MQLCFQRLIEWGVADAPARAPLFPHDLPIKDDPLPRFLDDAAATKLLVAARADPDPLVRLIVEFLARTGMRKGELVNLTIDAVVQIGRLRDGSRRVVSISEVQGMEGDTIVMQDIFMFDYGMGVDEHGRFRGHLKATGTRPKFAEKLADLGIRLGPEVFQPEGFSRRSAGAR